MSQQPLLIELGTEELPPKALSSLSQAFTAGVLAGLGELELAHGAVRSFATPRRLAILIEDVADSAEAKDVELLGPPADRARDDNGDWSKAAIGFARKNGVEPDALEVADTDKGPRLLFRTREDGARLADSLQAVVDKSIRDLPIPKRIETQPL